MAFEMRAGMMRRLAFFLFLVFFSPTAYASLDCRAVLREPELELLDCTDDSGLRTLSLTVRPALAPPLAVEAAFDLWLSPVLPQRIRGLSGRRELSAFDQEIIQRALQFHPAIGESSQALLRFLAFFAQPGMVLADFDLSGRNLLVRASYTSLCSRVGHSATATYTLGGRTYTKKVVVGGSNCLGQCGVGCQDSANPRNGRYTQECLNHDACAHATGDNMGECSDEFWAAADGFFSAPVCQ